MKHDYIDIGTALAAEIERNEQIDKNCYNAAKSYSIDTARKLRFSDQQIETIFGITLKH